MWKCYLIACDLQTTQNAESSSNIPATIVRAIIRGEHIEDAIYALDRSCHPPVCSRDVHRLTMNSVAIERVRS